MAYHFYSCLNIVGWPVTRNPPEFAGPLYETLVDGRDGKYKSFYFECGIDYQNALDDGARFDISLTFDGVVAATTITSAHRENLNPLAFPVKFVPNDFKYNLGKNVSQSSGIESTVKPDGLSLNPKTV